jgi:hypothetical protein
MGQIAMFPNPIERLFGSMSGLLSSTQGIIITIGVVLFIASIVNIIREKQIDVGEVISSFLISVVIILIGVFGPNLIKKILDLLDPKNFQSIITEQKIEKEISEEEKLKKLNAYRKSNNKDILLADTSVAEQYLSYLKDKNLDETALK